MNENFFLRSMVKSIGKTSMQTTTFKQPYIPKYRGYNVESDLTYVIVDENDNRLKLKKPNVDIKDKNFYSYLSFDGTYEFKHINRDLMFQIRLEFIKLSGYNKPIYVSTFKNLDYKKSESEINIQRMIDFGVENKELIKKSNNLLNETSFDKNPVLTKFLEGYDEEFFYVLHEPERCETYD